MASPFGLTKQVFSRKKPSICYDYRCRRQHDCHGRPNKLIRKTEYVLYLPSYKPGVLLLTKYHWKMFGVLKACYPILKGMASYSLQTQGFIVVVVIMLHNYIRQKNRGTGYLKSLATTSWLSLINDDEDEGDSMLTVLVSSHLPSKWTLSKTVSLMQGAIEWAYLTDECLLCSMLYRLCFRVFQWLWTLCNIL